MRTAPVSVPSAKDLAPVATAIPTTALQSIVSGACARIAPSWPLDRFIAVNPFWGLVDTPLPEVAARLRALSGASLLMPRTWYRHEYREGRLRDEHLAAALATTGSLGSLADLRVLLDEPEPTSPVRERVVDVIDGDRDLVHEVSWRSFVTHSVSQFCAAYFDEGQASLGPARDGGLYASWRRQAASDRGPAAMMGFGTYRGMASELPARALGSGNKVLHNIVGGHLGVFEGNGGDLRIGLPMQSLHDGAGWVHTPLRLTVIIEAPRAAIAAVLAKHAHVRALVTNGWIELFYLDAQAGAVVAFQTLA